MKKTSRILAIVLALVLVLSTGAFAAWVSFQNDGTNNGVIYSNAPIGDSIQVDTVQLPQGMYVGVDVPPVIDDSGYAYVLESAPTTTRLVKVDLANATIVTNNYWAGTGTGNEGVEIRDVSAFQLSTPVIDGNYVYVASTDFAQKNTDEDFSSLLTSSSDWTITNISGTPHFDSFVGGFIKVTGGANVRFTLSQAFEGVAGDNLRLECVVLGSALGSGASYSVYLNDSLVPLATFDLTQPIGYAFNNSVSNSDLLTGTNTVTIDIQFNGTQKNAYVQLGDFRLYEESGSVLRVDRATGAKTTIVDGIPGQLNTPLTIKDSKLYFGSYYAGGGKYYQVDLNAATPTAVSYNSNHSHYWSGAYVSSSKAYFGGYGGMLYYPDVTNFASTTNNSFQVGYGGITAGDISSSICYKNNKIYFTCKNGYLWCYDITNGNPVFSWYANLGAPSTSTPVVSTSGLIYVGTYSGFSGGSVVVVKAPTSGVIGTVNTVYSGDPVQSSAIVMNDGEGYDYCYFTTNAVNGAGYCYYINTEDVSDTDEEWSTVGQTGNTFTLQGMAAYGNCVVFGNDGSRLYIVTEDNN